MATTPPPTLYELLHLPNSATAEELRLAFRRLSKRYHPDTTTLPAGQAEDAFQAIRHAYAVLSDPTSRRAYDARIAPSPSLPPMAAPGVSMAARSQPLPVRRALSGGEWFALLLLGAALLLSLTLGLSLAWLRGTELVQRPSWWDQRQVPLAAPLDISASDAQPPDSRDPSVPPPPAGPGGLAAGDGSHAAAAPW